MLASVAAPAAEAESEEEGADEAPAEDGDASTAGEAPSGEDTERVIAGSVAVDTLNMTLLV